jgi:hypothetical protein
MRYLPRKSPRKISCTSTNIRDDVTFSKSQCLNYSLGHLPLTTIWFLKVLELFRNRVARLRRTNLEDSEHDQEHYES